MFLTLNWDVFVDVFVQSSLIFANFSLSFSGGKRENWYAMDDSVQDGRKKYYINICRPLNPVPGCDRWASVCERQYKQVDVSIFILMPNYLPRILVLDYLHPCSSSIPCPQPSRRFECFQDFILTLAVLIFLSQSSFKKLWAEYIHYSLLICHSNPVK